MKKRYYSGWIWPGDEDQSHVANESIAIKELIDFRKIIGLITFDILK